MCMKCINEAEHREAPHPKQTAAPSSPCWYRAVEFQGGPLAPPRLPRCRVGRRSKPLGRALPLALLYPLACITRSKNGGLSIMEEVRSADSRPPFAAPGIPESQPSAGDRRNPVPVASTTGRSYPPFMTGCRITRTISLTGDKRVYLLKKS